MKKLLRRRRNYNNLRRQFEENRTPCLELKILKMMRVSKKETVLEWAKIIASNYLLLATEPYYDVNLVRQLLETRDECLIRAARRFTVVWQSLQLLEEEFHQENSAWKKPKIGYELLFNQDLAQVRVFQQGGLNDEKLEDILLGYADMMPELYATYLALRNCAAETWQKVYNVDAPA